MPAAFPALVDLLSPKHTAARLFAQESRKGSLRRITADMIVKYQSERKAAGVSGCSINLEVGLLRRIMKRHKQWGRLAEAVEMLPPQRYKPARVPSPEEKVRLLELAASQREWQIAHRAAILALNTTIKRMRAEGINAIWT